MKRKIKRTDKQLSFTVNFYEKPCLEVKVLSTDQLYKSNLELNELVARALDEREVEKLLREQADPSLPTPPSEEQIERLRQAVKTKNESLHNVEAHAVYITDYILDNLPSAIAWLLFMLELEADLHSGYTVKCGQTIPKAFAIILKFQRNIMRSRLELRGRGGRNACWTQERRADILTHYERVLLQIRNAREIYRRNCKDKGWRTKVTEAYPELSNSVIDKLPLRAFQPSDIAREHVAEVFGVPANEYLRKVLKQARRERRGLRDIEIVDPMSIILGGRLKE